MNGLNFRDTRPQTAGSGGGHLCSGVKLLASWLISAQGTANGGLWRGRWLGGPALVTGCSGTCTGRGAAAGLATLRRGGGACSLSECVPAVLVGPHGDTGVEGGVNGLNPEVGFLSQALWTSSHQYICGAGFSL